MNNKRIARNTIFLYIRMIVTTVISLITVRLILKLLGVEDYGIYNTVGSVTGFINVITGSMVSASQRFLACDIGRGDIKQYQRTFSMLLNVLFIFCSIVLVMMELMGPYLIAKFLVIPQDRLVAAQWLFQFSVFAFISATIVIPYSSSIIAYERMGVYAFFTFIDVALKLIVVFILYEIQTDRLIAFGALTLFMSFVSNGIISWYCVKKLDGCKYTFYWDKSLFKKIFSYSGWNLVGSTTYVMNNQGQAVLLNLFFGPTVNAAKGIADRINSAVSSFCSNFYMAVNPQIIKTYAMGELGYTKKLVLVSSKFAFYMMLILSLPLIFNMESLLTLWLGEEQISFEMLRFCQIALVYTLINTTEGPITQAVRASGDIKRYQIEVGAQTLLFIPITYILFRYGFPSYYSMIVLSVIYFLVQFTRIRLLGNFLEITLVEYLKHVLAPIYIVSILSAVTLYFITIRTDVDVQTVVYNLIFAIIVIIFAVYFFGLSRKERVYFKNIVTRVLCKNSN